MSSSEITEFYRDQTVFITGGTGFLGKVLIEKLLRRCEPKKIFVLVRPKKGKTVQDRLDDFFSFKCFDRIKEEMKNYKETVCFVSGDCASVDLDLAKEEEEMLVKETTIVIHAAANVKFDQTLREAANNNVRSTVSVLSLANRMPLLKAFVFVSTAYSNCIHEEIKEEFYPPPMTYHQLFSILDALDDGALEDITPKLLKKWPNTYVYTKSIAENAVKTLGKDLPAAIVRPAIVTMASKEPLPGWLDNFYGVIGIGVAGGVGILNSFYMIKEYVMNMVPVDYVSNAVLAATFGVQKMKNEEPIIYNFAGHEENLTTWGFFNDFLLEHKWLMPDGVILWYPYFQPNGNKLLHEIHVFFSHTLFSYVIDAVLFCLRKPTIAVRSYRKFDKAMNLLSYFPTRQWNFRHDNLMKLWKEMNDEDRQLFNFNLKTFAWDKYLYDGIIGSIVYLLKTKPREKEEISFKLAILFIVRYAMIALVWFLIYKLIRFVMNLFF